MAETGDFTFSRSCGARTGFSANKRTAYRKDPSSCYDGALAISHRPMRRREFFEIRIDSLRADKWTGSLAIGVIKCLPHKVDFASIDAFNELPPAMGRTWGLSEDEVRTNTQKVLCSKYSLNLDGLSQGERVGLMVKENSALHYFLNGKDMGCAATDIPKGVYAVVDVYGQCCELSIVPKDKVSVKSTPVMEEGGQEELEKEDTEDEVTAAPVTTRKSTRDVEVVDFTSQMLPSAGAFSSNAISQVVPPPTEDFTAQVLHSSSMTSGSASMQPAATVAATVKTDFDFTGQVLPGEQPSLVEKTESLTVGIARTRAGNAPTEAHMTRRTAEQSVCRMRFSTHCGQNIRLARDCCSATRVNGFSEGILMSERKIPNDTVFEVRLKKMNPHWEGTVSLGITTLQPSKACHFASAAEIAHHKSETWVLYLDHLYRNAKEVKDLYVNLSNCIEGQTVGFFCSQDPTYGTDTWFLVLNGRTVHKLAVKVPRERYAVVDVYGQCIEVELLPLRDATALKEEKATQAKMKKGGKQPVSSDNPSTLRAPRKGKEDTSRPQRPCVYKDLCSKYLSQLRLPDCYFEPTPVHNKCFCLECHKWRNDLETYSRGTPPAVYALPLGWSRFALKTPPRAQSVNAFRDYHIAFHGTRASSLLNILDSGTLLLPGDISLGGKVVSPPDNHYTEDRKPPEHDTSQIFLSPSIKYAGCTAYAPPERFIDPDSGKAYKAKVAFQVLIRPRSYQVGTETVGATQQGTTIDPQIPNNEIEWATKEKVATILYGLLVELREEM